MLGRRNDNFMEEANNPEEKVDSCPKNQLPTPKGLPGDYKRKEQMAAYMLGRVRDSCLDH